MNPKLVIFAALIAAPAPKEAPKKDPPSIVGQWLIASSTRDGKVNKEHVGLCVDITHPESIDF